MNKGIIIGIIIAVAIAVGLGVLMSSDNIIQSSETDGIAGTEEVTSPKDYSVQLEESVDIMATP